MSKEQRKKKFMKILDEIYNYYDYEDFYNMRNEIEKFAKENNCKTTDVEYGDYPSEVEW